MPLTSFTRHDERADERNVFCETLLCFGSLSCSLAVRVRREKRVCPAWLLAAIKLGEKLFLLFECLFVDVTHCCQLSHTGNHRLVSIFFFFFRRPKMIHKNVSINRKVQIGNRLGNEQSKYFWNFEFPALVLLAALAPFYKVLTRTPLVFCRGFSFNLKQEKRWKMSR